MAVKLHDVKKLLGKQVRAVKKDGTIVTGKLVSVKGGVIHIRPKKGMAQTKAILPLVLYDLLAIGYYGAYGPGPYYGGYGYPTPYGGFYGFW